MPLPPPAVHALVATTFAAWLPPLMKYQLGASAWLTLPLSGHGWPEVACTLDLIGVAPPPSAALTVQSTTPAGVSPALPTSAHNACSSTVVPEALLVPPREKNTALPASPALATSANACAMLFAAFAPTPAGSAVDPANTKSLVQIALPNWLSIEKPLATNWFSSDAACTISALGPPVPFIAD